MQRPRGIGIIEPAGKPNDRATQSSYPTRPRRGHSHSWRTAFRAEQPAYQAHRIAPYRRPPRRPIIQARCGSTRPLGDSAERVERPRLLPAQGRATGVGGEVIRVGDLFAGIGGFALATKRVGWETAWFSEIHPGARKVLARHFPGTPNHGDITQIDFAKVERPRVLCGGFPCQDISIANQFWSKRPGLDGIKSGLWTHYERAVGDLGPDLIVVENSPELTRKGLDRVLGGLAALGYDAEWDCLPANFFGAHHRRLRIYLVAYPRRQGLARPFQIFHAVSLATQQGFPLTGDESAGPWDSLVEGCADIRSRDGLSPRLDKDRLFGCGNAVVPQIPEAIFRACIAAGVI